MTKISGIILLWLASVSLLPAQGITFTEGNWAALKAQALEADKVIFMDAYTTWCGPCKWLAANVFTDEAVGAFMNEHFINVKFDMEKGEGIELAETYGVLAYPTLLFINGNGELVHRICGAKPAEGFLEDAKQVVQGDDLLIGKQKAYEATPEDPTLAADYLVALAEGCAESNGLETVFYEGLTPEQRMQPYAIEVMENYPPALSSATFAFLAENIARYTDAYGDAPAAIVTQAVVNKLRPLLYNDLEAYPEEKAALLARNLPGIDEAILSLDLSYYERTDNWLAFAEQATQYIDRYASDDANTMNNLAWTVYESTDEPAAIAAAIEWARIGIDIAPSYSIWDTYAALLLKHGQTVEGKAAVAKAIAIAKAEGEDYSATEALLEEYEEE